MKKKGILARMAHNNKTRWFLDPIIARSKIIAERNQRIKTLVEKAFP